MTYLPTLVPGPLFLITINFVLWISHPVENPYVWIQEHPAVSATIAVILLLLLHPPIPSSAVLLVDFILKAKAVGKQ
jgi:hypothetical protein